MGPSDTHLPPDFQPHSRFENTPDNMGDVPVDYLMTRPKPDHPVYSAEFDTLPTQPNQDKAKTKVLYWWVVAVIAVACACGYYGFG